MIVDSPNLRPNRPGSAWPPCGDSGSPCGACGPQAANLPPQKSMPPLGRSCPEFPAGWGEVKDRAHDAWRALIIPSPPSPSQPAPPVAPARARCRP